MLLKVNLGHNAEYTLTYRLFDNNVARRIWQMYRDYNDFDFVSRTQFYNWGESENEVRALLQESVTQIRRLRPDLFVSDSSNEDDLNRLHEVFPANVHNEQGETKHWLSMFNYHLHHLEDITRNKSRRILLSVNKGGVGSELLSDDDYNLFTVAKHSNYLYMNYPHVGKHIAEIYFDNDVDIPASHITPTSIIKPDLLCWFDKDYFADTASQVELTKKIQRWCLQIVDKLPCDVSSNRMAIGHIPLGVLAHELDADAVNKHKYVHSVEAVE